MSSIDPAAERLYMFGRRFVTAVRTENPSDYMAALARLDRGELEHLVVLLAASVPDEVGGGRRLGPPVGIPRPSSAPSPCGTARW